MPDPYMPRPSRAAVQGRRKRRPFAKIPLCKQERHRLLTSRARATRGFNREVARGTEPLHAAAFPYDKEDIESLVRGR